MSDEPKPLDKFREKAKGNWVKTGVAVGVGSAAIVAALLYANRKK